MKALKTILAILGFLAAFVFVFAAGAALGAKGEANSIELSCNDANQQWTHIGEHRYVCLNEDMFNTITRRLQERGA